MEIGFYHLTRSSLEQALPKLLAKALAVPGRAMVLAGDAERLAGLDAMLWAADEWLPHNTPSDPTAEPALHPIWLTTQDGPAPNAARHLFLVEGAQSAHLGAFERAFDLFDGADEVAVAAARARFRAAREAGHTLSYWQQSENSWVKR